MIHGVLNKKVVGIRNSKPSRKTFHLKYDSENGTLVATKTPRT